MLVWFCWSENRLEGIGIICLVPAEGSLGSRGGGTSCSRLEGPVGQNALGELLLGFTEAGPGPSVLGMDHFQKDDGEDGVYSKEAGYHHHDHSHSYIGINHADCSNPSTVSPLGDSYRLDDVHCNLEEKHKEEEEEAEGTVRPEGPVDWSVPADEGHRGKQDEPEDGQTKIHTVA